MQRARDGTEGSTGPPLITGSALYSSSESQTSLSCTWVVATVAQDTDVSVTTKDFYISQAQGNWIREKQVTTLTQLLQENPDPVFHPYPAGPQGAQSSLTRLALEDQLPGLLTLQQHPAGRCVGGRHSQEGTD